jgi:hypothetical protein
MDSTDVGNMVATRCDCDNGVIIATTGLDCTFGYSQKAWINLRERLPG